MIMKENWKRSAVKVFLRFRERYALRMGFLRFRHQALFNRSDPVLFASSNIRNDKQKQEGKRRGNDRKGRLRSARDGDSGAGERGLARRPASTATAAAPPRRSLGARPGRKHPPTTSLLYSSPPTTKYGKERFRAHRAHRLWHVVERQRKKYLRVATHRWCNMVNLKRAQMRAALYVTNFARVFLLRSTLSTWEEYVWQRDTVKTALENVSAIIEVVLCRNALHMLRQRARRALDIESGSRILQNVLDARTAASTSKAFLRMARMGLVGRIVEERRRAGR